MKINIEENYVIIIPFLKFSENAKKKSIIIIWRFLNNNSFCIESNYLNRNIICMSSYYNKIIISDAYKDKLYIYDIKNIENDFIEKRNNILLLDNKNIKIIKTIKTIKITHKEKLIKNIFLNNSCVIISSFNTIFLYIKDINGGYIKDRIFEKSLIMFDSYNKLLDNNNIKIFDPAEQCIIDYDTINKKYLKNIIKIDSNLSNNNEFFFNNIFSSIHTYKLFNLNNTCFALFNIESNLLFLIRDYILYKIIKLDKLIKFNKINIIDFITINKNNYNILFCVDKKILIEIKSSNKYLPNIRKNENSSDKYFRYILSDSNIFKEYIIYYNLLERGLDIDNFKFKSKFNNKRQPVKKLFF